MTGEETERPGGADGATTDGGGAVAGEGAPVHGAAGRPTANVERDDPPRSAPDDPAVCGYCGARFVGDELLALHRGLAHRPELDDRERDAYADALAAERDDLRLFRLQALAALLLIYFGFVFVYAFVL